MDISSLRERSSPTGMTVAELNEFIKNVFDTNRLLTSVTVKGEISNFTNHRSGHFYFSLKDCDAQIKCIMFRSAVAKLKFIPENGMKITAHGSVSVFVRDGTYQLYVNSMQPDGVGALYMAYEQLKTKLDAEGLFSDEKKKSIPRFPKSIGVITSPTGAAVRDIINVTKRRYPLAKIYLFPSLVQGEGAEENLLRALNYFDTSGLADTLIIGRGGGSIEDLWAFNSERLARKIADMTIPVISAVGHETDFTICDFVSDLRAPTPSAAAELAVPDIRELILIISDSSDRLQSSLVKTYNAKREKTTAYSEKIKLLASKFFGAAKKDTEIAYERLKHSILALYTAKLNEMKVQAEKLNAMSPLSTLSRGYTLAEFGGKAVTSTKEINVGDNLKLKFSDGSVYAEVKSKIQDEA